MGDKRDFIYRMIFRILFIASICVGVKARAMTTEDEQLFAQVKAEAEKELASLEKKYDQDNRDELARVQAMNWELKPIMVGSQDPTCEGGDCEDEEIAKSFSPGGSVVAGFPTAP
jgi:hypothetical protein